MELFFKKLYFFGWKKILFRSIYSGLPIEIWSVIIIIVLRLCSMSVWNRLCLNLCHHPLNAVIKELSTSYRLLTRCKNIKWYNANQPTNQQWGIIKVRAIAEEAQFIIIVFRLFNGIEKFLTLSGCTTKAI